MVIHVEPFWGNKADENAQDFICSFNRAMGDKDETYKAKQFEYYLRADSEADEWWSELDAEKKKKWSDVEAAFQERWLKAKVVKKTATEYKEELLGLKLKIEDLGRKEEVAGRETYTHIVWADKMVRLAKGVGVESGSTYIGQVIKGLPRVLKEKVAGSYKSWDAFLTAVREVDMEYVKEGVEEYMREQKEKEESRARVKMLEALPATSMAALTQQMAAVNVGGNMQQQGGGGRGAFGGGGQLRRALPGNGPRPAAQPVTPDLQAKIRAALAAMPHHPDMVEGRQAHKEQQLEWARKHGATAWVTEDMPYPLRPGTAPVCSGECFRCGKVGHRGAECAVPRENQLMRSEQAWRLVCTRVLGGSQGAAVGMQWVATSDYGNREEVALGEGDQGNGVGSSA
ncbi:hypothetical protein EST38_g7385 [Candolleomyces aberdarensis]|uniref:CCHC-type domain-containing protein n=1 Tax=Candolleomyces aberdarensis TaxID=2316362 RepID=A0A4Q2DH46_9AGAR|nr:hypothetical protein EST38_g7385 [Candolleomyces aberdarensis]